MEHERVGAIDENYHEKSSQPHRTIGRLHAFPCSTLVQVLLQVHQYYYLLVKATVVAGFTGKEQLQAEP